MADRLDMKSMDITGDNIAKIKALFPSAVTEVMGDDGKVKLAIDFDALKQELSEDLISEKAERYQMTWPDKSKAKVLANSRISATLRPDKEKSVDFDNTENLYIEGDNLDVLKLLRETYLGKVKMIYIDPPYNTGNDFVYNDDFAMSADDYDEVSGQYDEQGNRLVKNLDSNGRFHTDWLNMIYPRLKVARDLLTDDGVIFISIDDNEIDNLLHCCYEIFGESNIIATFVIASNSAKNNSKYVSITHEYLVCIAKSKDSTPINWSVPKTNSDSFVKISQSLLKSGKTIDEIHSELLALVKYPKYYEFDHYTYVDKRGPFRASDLTAPGSKLRYDVIHPITKKACKVGTRGWAYSEPEMKKLIDSDYILFGKDESVMPQLKNYLFENEESLPKSILFFDSQSSTKWMKSQNFGFDFPKAIDYIKFIISMYPQKDFILLDFFSGSATTAHAVMQINAEDGGNRKFIMVQLPEKCGEKSEAYKTGYKTICDIGQERIRRAGKKIVNDLKVCGQERKIEGYTLLRSGYGGAYQYAEWKNNETGEIKTESRDVHEPKDFYKYYPNELDIGFRVLKLDSSNMQIGRAHV